MFSGKSNPDMKIQPCLMNRAQKRASTNLISLPLPWGDKFLYSQSLVVPIMDSLIDVLATRSGQDWIQGLKINMLRTLYYNFIILKLEAIPSHQSVRFLSHLLPTISWFEPQRVQILGAEKVENYILNSFPSSLHPERKWRLTDQSKLSLNRSRKVKFLLDPLKISLSERRLVNIYNVL